MKKEWKQKVEGGPHRRSHNASEDISSYSHRRRGAISSLIYLLRPVTLSIAALRTDGMRPRLHQYHHQLQ